ncbi:hypothetical protein [Rhizobium sp. Root1220]|uniref:hypothetical protein n=1 Tax=Rhizobium sp. Root1220 TaxID=1736432 RepID=UPI0006F3C548|nr:hypothetical protein [Rhizobium sp. Root1220]KQV73017.1 hypothetical protein ASC90_06275 [Rhizobium sp. Root1220]
MFFLGGMTMGYLQPPEKAERETIAAASIPAEKDRRLLEAARESSRENAVERSLLWAWRTLC